MMSRTGDRLRDVATAVGAAVTEQDLPELRLAEQLPVRRRWSGGRWLVPLVAAVSVIAAVGAAAVFGKLLAVSRDRPHSALIPGPALIRPVTGTPGYLVTSQLGRGSVISVATGRTIAKIPPPVKGYVIEGIAAGSGDSGPVAGQQQWPDEHRRRRLARWQANRVCPAESASHRPRPASGHDHRPQREHRGD
jgi:hypothetical protein